MDVGLGIVEAIADLACQVAVAIAELVAALTEIVVGALVELLLVLIEAGIYVVLWVASPFLLAEHRSHKLSVRSRLVFRRVVYVLLVLGAVSALVYFFWLREPASQPPPQQPTKIEKACRVFEKAKQIKERLLPPKTEP